MVDVRSVEIPLKVPFVTAVRTATALKSLQIALQGFEGLTGFGEAPLNSPIVGQSHLWAAVEMALWDLAARNENMPLYRFLGGQSKKDSKIDSEDGLTNDITISAGCIDSMTKSAIEAIKDGFTILKIKTGKNPATDAQQMIDLWDNLRKQPTPPLQSSQPMQSTQSLQFVQSQQSSQPLLSTQPMLSVQPLHPNKAVPPVSFRIDANQGWDAAQAIKIIRTWEDAGIPIDLIEQPVPSWDLNSMAQIQAHTDLPIAADESVYTYTDALLCIQKKAARIINIKLMKTGGIGPALDICRLCRDEGIECMIGCMLEGQIGAAAAIHLAASQDVVTRIDVDSPLLCVPGYYENGPVFEGHKVILSDDPGIGTVPIL